MIYAICKKNIDPMSEELLDISVGVAYEVTSIVMGGWFTDIRLKERHGTYNSVLFEFYELKEEKLEILDIYKDKRFNPYLREDLIQ